MAVNVAQEISKLLEEVFGSKQSALQFVGDPYGELAARGITEGDLSNVDIDALAKEACNQPGVPASAQTAVQAYTATPHPPAHSVEQVREQVTQVIQQTYIDDRDIYDIVNNENNTKIEVGDNFEGDIDVDNDNLTGGDRAVLNSGDDADVTAATGDRANANSGDGPVNQNSGDGGVVAGGNITGPVITGNDNQTVNAPGASGDVIVPFGSGDTSVIKDNTITDSAVSGTGNAHNSSNNTASEGGAISGEGDATGKYEYEESYVEVYDNSGPVNVEGGPGDQSDDDTTTEPVKQEV